MKLDSTRKTKIVCTIGPACQSPRIMEKMVRAGMNVARINLSHGDEDQHLSFIRQIRDISSKLAVPLAVMIDTPGPRYRTGDLKEGQAKLEKGATLVLTSRRVPGDQKEVSLNLPFLVRDVKPGSELLLDDGAIRLRVRSTTDTDIVTEVLIGGILKPRRGIAAPRLKMSAPYMTGYVEDHIKLALKEEADYLALSFVASSQDILAVRENMARTGRTMPLIAKIERREAVRDLDGILAMSDGAMVARGDLGIEVALEAVPLIQKDIIRKCNQLGKPSITATQMLESMTNASSPTRAEVADVANAIFDGTDAVMLSAETAIGNYPVQAVLMMSRIAKKAESGLPQDRMVSMRDSAREGQTDDAIAYAACHTAEQIGARAILAFTESGSTAWRVSKYRPQVAIVAFTPNESVTRTLALAWGVSPYKEATPRDVDDIFLKGRDLARELGVARKGDLAVITGGVPVGVTGTTNMLKVEQI